MRFSWLAALCLFVSSAGAGRPYTVDDMLKLESYGQVRIDPTGRTVIVERRDPYQTSARFDFGPFVTRQLSKLYTVDLLTGDTLEPLFEQRPDGGYWMGSFSPSGKKLSVFRLLDGKLSLGVFDFAAQEVTWLPVTPDLPKASPAPIWLDEHRLIVVALADGALPDILANGSAIQKRSTELWKMAASGERSSASVFGSGRYREAGFTDKKQQVRLLDLRSGTGRELIEEEAIDAALSADGRFLAVLYEGQLRSSRREAPVEFSSPPRNRSLQIIEIASGQRWTPCGRCDVMPFMLAWSPAGADLLFFARPEGADWKNGSLYRASAARRLVTVLNSKGLDPSAPSPDGAAAIVYAAWMGDHPMLRARPSEGKGRTDWFYLGTGSPRLATGGLPEPAGALAATEGNAFYIVNGGALWRGRADGRVEPVLEADIASTKVAQLDIYSFGGRHLFTTVPHELAFVRTGEPAGGTIRYFEDGTAGPPCGLPPSVSILAADPRFAVAIGHQAGRGAGKLIRLPCGAQPQSIDTINEHLDGVENARAIPVRSSTKEGGALTHWLFLPPAGGEALPPLVVIPYPGAVFPDASAVEAPINEVDPTPNAQLLASNGFAVLIPSLPLPDGPGDPIDRFVPLILDAVDAAVATGKVDGSRLAAWGHSYGGYAVLALAVRTDRFDALISSSGPSDLIAKFGEGFEHVQGDGRVAIHLSSAAWLESGQGRMGAPPWDALERYARNSPALHVDDVETPLMLLHGDVDYVAHSQAGRMFFGLLRLDKDALYVRYGGEGHSFHSPANIRDQWARVLAFLGDHLEGGDGHTGGSGSR